MKKGRVATISFGMVIILGLLFAYINATVLFPQNSEQMRGAILANILIIASAIAINAFSKIGTVQTLFKANFLKSVVTKVPLVAIGTALILGAITYATKGSFSIVALGTSIGVAIIYYLIVAIVEEIFRETLYDAFKAQKGIKKYVARFLSISIWAVFHYGMAGGEWLILLIYLPLGYIFSYLRELTPKTMVANTTAHWLYDVWVVLFMS